MTQQKLVGHQQGVLHDFEEKLLEMVDDELEVGAEDLDDGGEPSDMAST